MKTETLEIFKELFLCYPALEACRDDIAKAYEVLLECYRGGGKVLTCGNGGSASDSEHIVGELLKKFKKHRSIDVELKTKLESMGNDGKRLSEKLEGSLAAVSLVSMSGILTAFANDVGWDEAFAQQLLGLGREGDVLMTLSTSGNSRNCVEAALVAKAIGVKSIGLTGTSGGRFREVCDVSICVPGHETYKIQELHLPVYHALCAMLESELFS